MITADMGGIDAAGRTLRRMLRSRGLGPATGLARAGGRQQQGEERGTTSHQRLARAMTSPKRAHASHARPNSPLAQRRLIEPSAVFTLLYMLPNSSQHDPNGQRNPYAQAQQYAPGYSGDPRAQLAAGVDQFMTRVNTWMAAGVGITGLVAFVISLNEALVFTLLATPLKWVVFLAPLAFVWIFASRVHTMKPSTATGLFLFYAALNGVSFSAIFIVYSLGSIATVFAITTIMYGSLSLWGFVTKRDLSAWGKFLFMGLVGMLISGLFFMFVPGVMGSTVYLIYNVIGVLLFSALTAYDTQKIKQMYLMNGGAGNLAILGALELYLDFINLFLFLLRLFGGSRD
jgi:FtsH-binding integral membrane protein